MEKVLPDRQSLHLKWFDYNSSAVYFITVCTHERIPFFGHISDGRMHLNEAGMISQKVWLSLPERFAGVVLDKFVFMPNHMHGLLFIYSQTNVKNMPPQVQAHMQALMEERRPELKASHKAVPLWEIVRTFKAASTRLIRVAGPQQFSWQKRYWHEVICNQTRLSTLRTYICDNPQTWRGDKLYIPEP